MAIWDVCIRRPVFTAMLLAAPLVFGMVCYSRLGVDLFPNVDVPVVAVSTVLRGASVEEMESTVTKPLEEICNTVSGIDELRSTTREGFSQIIIQFVLEKNGATAAQEVESKVRSILSQLPEGTQTPIIDRFDLDASPVLSIALSGRRDPREVTELARKSLKEDLESLPGVGRVVVTGGRARAIQVEVDPERLLKYEGLGITDIRRVLAGETQELPGGRVEQGTAEIGLRTMGRVARPEDLLKLIIANRSGQPIRLEDVATVADSVEEPRSSARLHRVGESDPARPGDPAVTLLVQRQSRANIVKVVDTVLRRVEELKAILPPDVKLAIVRDQSRFIKKSFEELRLHCLMAALLVSLTVLLFIRDWRTTVIATLSIPLSIIATFAFMEWMDFTLNNITMLGLILAVGIVIDDAVVVHENIFRHMEEIGKPPMKAAGDATAEIAQAVVATTLSLLVIFMPIAFMNGRVGRFFSSFGMVIAFSIFMSMIVSFTMTPMLCSRFLLPETHGARSKSGLVWRIVEKAYLGILAWSLGRRWVVVVLSVALMAATPALFGKVGKEFVPRDDQSEFEVVATLPEGWSLERVERLMVDLESRLRKLPGVRFTFLQVGDTGGREGKAQGNVSTASVYVRLSELEERDFSQFDVMNEARALVSDYPDLRAAVQDVSAFNGTGFRQVMIDFNMRGPDMLRLKDYSDELARWMREQGYFVDVDTSLSLRKPELRIIPDRERASELGVTVESIAQAAGLLVGGEIVARYKEADEQYDVWLRARPESRQDRATLEQLSVPSTRPGAGPVRLASVARFEYAMGPQSIDRFSRQRQVVISANLEGVALGEAVSALTAKVKSLDLPADYRWEFIGRAKLLAEQGNSFAIAFILSVVFMYMVLAGQFESFLHPVTIMLSLPLTIPFAVFSLVVLRTSLDIYATFGMFMLFGIVKKNGILQVDAANQARARGMGRDEAILEANRSRLRPILMTTVMLVAAMLPMAMGEGPGAASRAGMAKLIMGGQALSLLLTLLIVPVVSTFWDDVGSWWARRRARPVVETA